jgi:hypothetical protein
MNIIVKKSEQRIDPRQPETNPNYQRSLEVGLDNYKSMKFESDGQRNDYMRAVKSNPNNVPGVPPFYPPARIISKIAFHDKAVEDTRTVGERLLEESFTTIYVKCSTCESLHGTVKSITPHIVKTNDSFCQVCGTRKGFRL